MEAVIIALLILLVALAGVALWITLQRQRSGPTEAEALAEAQRAEQMAALRSELTQAVSSGAQQTQQALQAQMNAIDLKVNQRLDAVQGNIDRSLTSTSETIGKIGEQLGTLGESARRILEVGHDVSSLKDVLQPPKLRGNFGELLLEQLVQQILPPAAYSMQHRFSDASIVDLVIRTPDGLVPIDSKFPVDTFRRMLDAPDDEERTRQRRAFIREVKMRIDQVAKYIRPEDETMDFALMYVPAENIYYEALAGSEDESCMSYALERRVHLVSPNTFHAFLQVVARGFRGLQVEQNAKEIVARLEQLGNDFGKFRQEFEVLGGHVGRAKNKYDELEKAAGRLSDRLQQQLGQPTQASLPDPEAVMAGGVGETNGASEPRRLFSID